MIQTNQSEVRFTANVASIEAPDWQIAPSFQNMNLGDSEVYMSPFLIRDGIYLKTTIPLSITKGMNEVIVGDTIFNRFGIGQDIISALNDYFESLASYFEGIEEVKESNAANKEEFTRLLNFLGR